MAKNIKENRVVNTKNTVLATPKNGVVEDKPRKKWAGLVADEKELKRWKNAWKEIEANITKFQNVY